MLTLALLGFGNVAKAFARHLLGQRDPIPCLIRAVADVSGGTFLDTPGQLPRLLETPAGLLKDSVPAEGLLPVPSFLSSLPAAGIAVLVECLPTNITDGQPALDYLEAVLRSGVAVVTVDKGPVVHGYRRLAQAARDGGVRIAHTGTTGVRPPREIHGKSVTEIAGIFNGTTNFILTRMWQDSVPFAAALAEARASGIAEPDPALDVDGWDTACKILILASRWMGAESTLAAVSRRGIGAGTEALVDSARASGDAVRLIGRARKTAEGVQIAVAPERAGPESRFFNVSGTSKGALFTTAEGEQFFSEGRSGREQIAQTILEDILSVAGSSGSAYPADPPCPP